MDPVTLDPSCERQVRNRAHLRRSLFLSLTFLTSLAASTMMFGILDANGLTLLESLSLILFFVLFTWITGAFWTAIAGFIIQLIGRDSAVIHSSEVDGRQLAARIAIVMPIYNEDPDRVAAGLDVIWQSLLEQPQGAAFDLFMLSDTRKPELAAREEAAWRTLVTRHHALGRIFYRRRAQNIGRKAGNLADFVQQWGAAYQSMVVLDADSIMTGDALVKLALLLEAHPEIGIIQALPQPVGRETLFARLVQFAARLNGPMLSNGLAFWQLSESNYWGHNAIIRMRPFAACCALPKLPGSPPLGGEILSHDFVEAAFMRRAGYKVWLAPDIGGSWEEIPSNIIDFAARDRRWAQGNMQHFKVLPARGLHWLSRLHMLTGILSYATSPIWMTVLVLSSIVICMEASEGHQYFQPGIFTLFPDWPESRTHEIASLLTFTIIVLLFPKVLGLTSALLKPELRRGFGGVRSLVPSLLLEQLFSMLLAPPMMVFHATFVVSTLLGKPVSWDAQERGDRGVPLGQAMRQHKWQVLLGLAWGAVILSFAPRYIWWMSPVLIGLLLAPFLTVVTSRLDLGLALKRAHLLMTPEETDVPREVAAVKQVPPVDAEARADLALALPPLAPLSMEPIPLSYPSWRSAPSPPVLPGVEAHRVEAAQDRAA